jgi:hypothetical protein
MRKLDLTFRENIGDKLRRIYCVSLIGFGNARAIIRGASPHKTHKKGQANYT